MKKKPSKLTYFDLGGVEFGRHGCWEAKGVCVLSAMVSRGKAGLALALDGFGTPRGAKGGKGSGATLGEGMYGGLQGGGA